ncbi:DUF5133 domain-containing protein [Streptomyces afghaniensis]|uniref:DUF5133 domain-containing protein n=1 Tax=Streptomyces afghaniensis TaxID=66865 RepID=UPI00277ED21B|nr:hypothetical protein [Streptomyces afghaniensis]
MLLPAKAEVARQLRRYRAWERVMLAAPNDRTVRTTFEDSGYTLCVLMGKRCAREAADAAERYLRTNPATSVQEQNQVAYAPETQAACAHDPKVTYAPEPQAAYAQEPQLTRLQEQNERPRPATAIRRRPPAAERHSPAGR